MTNAQLEKCIEDYGTDLYSFCRHLTCNSMEADDLYQNRKRKYAWRKRITEEKVLMAEIAEVAKIPAGTVKSRLHQARRSLEKELEDVLDEKRHG